MSLANPLFWTALAKIIGVNVVLSGDNAVIGLAISISLVILGAALLVCEERAISMWTDTRPESVKYLAAALGAAAVVVVGQWLARRAGTGPAATEHHPAR